MAIWVGGKGSKWVRTPYSWGKIGRGVKIDGPRGSKWRLDPLLWPFLVILSHFGPLWACFEAPSGPVSGDFVTQMATYIFWQKNENMLGLQDGAMGERTGQVLPCVRCKQRPDASTAIVPYASTTNAPVATTATTRPRRQRIHRHCPRCLGATPSGGAPVARSRAKPSTFSRRESEASPGTGH